MSFFRIYLHSFFDDITLISLVYPNNSFENAIKSREKYARQAALITYSAARVQTLKRVCVCVCASFEKARKEIRIIKRGRLIARIRTSEYTILTHTDTHILHILHQTGYAASAAVASHLQYINTHTYIHIHANVFGNEGTTLQQQQQLTHSTERQRVFALSSAACNDVAATSRRHGDAGDVCSRSRRRRGGNWNIDLQLGLARERENAGSAKHPQDPRPSTQPRCCCCCCRDVVVYANSLAIYIYIHTSLRLRRDAVLLHCIKRGMNF